MALPRNRENASRLRILRLHGELILASDIKLFREKLPPKGCKITITSGSTAAGGVFSWIVRDEAIEGAVAPIGYIVSGKQVALVLEDGSNAPPGAVGELLVRGPTAMGSWQQGKVGPARFLPDPTDPTSKIYATGDLVRQRSRSAVRIRRPERPAGEGQGSLGRSRRSRECLAERRQCRRRRRGRDVEAWPGGRDRRVRHAHGSGPGHRPAGPAPWRGRRDGGTYGPKRDTSHSRSIRAWPTTSPTCRPSTVSAASRGRSPARRPSTSAPRSPHLGYAARSDGELAASGLNS